MIRYLYVAALFIGILGLNSCADDKAGKAERELMQLLAHYEREYIPIQKEYNLASFEAASTGSPESYNKASQLRYQMGQYFANKVKFKKLKNIYEANCISDKLLARQAALLYFEYLKHQIKPKIWGQIVELETKLKRRFTKFRVEVGNKVYTSNDVRDVLINSRDAQKLETFWKASKVIGETVAEDFKNLVKLRNKAAVELGFDNYFEMELFVSDQDLEQVDQIYSELDILTRGPYTQLKADIDKYLSAQYNIPADSLMPWHYQDVFFQNPPKIVDVNYDSLYRDKDIVGIGSNFYKSLGFDIEHIVRNSDLFPKEGKSQLGITKNIDYSGDVRMLLNVKPDEYSMNLFLYELGFAIYLKNISDEQPYILRRPAHFFTTDGVAILFSSLSTSPKWLKQTLALPDEIMPKLDKAFASQQRLNKFVFSRWAQVMYRFERSLYEDPDQNLNKLWWHLVENYQLINKPNGRNAPDWAVKEHLVLMPCKYHNYLLGELFAAQLYHHITQSIMPGVLHADSINFYDKKEIGNYLREEVFAPGAKYHWQDLVKHATGEELKPDYFYKQFINL